MNAFLTWTSGTCNPEWVDTWSKKTLNLGLRYFAAGPPSTPKSLNLKEETTNSIKTKHRYFIQVLILIVSSWTRGLEGSLQLAAGIVYLTILEIFGCSVHHQPRSQKTTNPVGTTKFIIPYQKQIPSIINNERAIKYSV